MNEALAEKNNNEFELDVMRKITNKPDITQRELAKQLGHSLGKLNFCLKELQNKKGSSKLKKIKKKIQIKLIIYMF